MQNNKMKRTRTENRPRIERGSGAENGFRSDKNSRRERTSGSDSGFGRDNNSRAENGFKREFSPRTENGDRREFTPRTENGNRREFTPRTENGNRREFTPRSDNGNRREFTPRTDNGFRRDRNSRSENSSSTENNTRVRSNSGREGSTRSESSTRTEYGFKSDNGSRSFSGQGQRRKSGQGNGSRYGGGSRKKSNGNRNSGKRSNVFDISKYESKGKADEVLTPYVNAHQFADFNLHNSLLERISGKGYITPTQVQDKAIPHAISGRDIIGVAGTGTGKTAAFLIPIIQDLIVNPINNKALIIAPTRELATQIFEEFRDLTRGMNLYSTCLIGGNPVHQSIRDLQRSNHIIIGTPGRLVDMSQRGHLKFGKFETLVLDEFDRMLDMGFVDEVRDINARMVAKKQTLLFSATIEKSIKTIIQEITKDPIEVIANTGVRPSASIEQEVMKVPSDKKKIDFLLDIVSEWRGQKILLFCTTKRKVDQVHKSLMQANITTDLIHGDKSQRAREVALRKFKSGKIDVLVATDVVARGIDVTDVSLVINYEIPHDYTDYIHRIGRTGRAGKLGKAITLID